MARRARVRNMRVVVRKIETMARIGGEANVSGLRVIGESIMTDVKASRPGQGVPRDTGALAASGRVISVPSGVDLTFGGPAAPYALRQHEELEYRHTVGEARYLIRGVERFAAGTGPMDALRANADAAIRAAKRAR